MTDSDRPLFFIHLMKTGGTTMKVRILNSFPESQIYPNTTDDPDQYTANLNIRYLTTLPEDRRRRTRIFAGHFPFVATEMLDMPLTRLTVLRDPVKRVISHVKQVRMNRTNWTDVRLDTDGQGPPTFEAVYENYYWKPRFFENYQARLFSITREDDALDQTHVVDVDADRLRLAKANLEKVDIIGLTEDLATFERELHHRFGISDRQMPPLRVSTDDSVISAELRQKIADDNAADIAFYEHAKQLIAQRRQVA